MHEQHHAWVGTSLEVIPETLRTQSTDVLHVVRDRFSIDDARELASLATQKPFAEEKRTFVLIVDDIAVEAQNALLKLFEEPPVHTQFFVIKPDTLELLPTLSSRLMKCAQKDKETVPSDLFSAFERAPYRERLQLVADKTKEKDMVWIESIVKGCEEKASREKYEMLMKNVVFVRSYLKKRGASPKMLLESLSLVLPQQ